MMKQKIIASNSPSPHPRYPHTHQPPHRNVPMITGARETSATTRHRDKRQRGEDETASASSVSVTSPTVVEGNERVTRNAAKLTIDAHKRANYMSCVLFCYFYCCHHRCRKHCPLRCSLRCSLLPLRKGLRCSFLPLLSLVYACLKRSSGRTTKTPGEPAGGPKARTKACDCV